MPPNEGFVQAAGGFTGLAKQAGDFVVALVVWPAVAADGQPVLTELPTDGDGDEVRANRWRTATVQPLLAFGALRELAGDA